LRTVRRALVLLLLAALPLAAGSADARPDTTSSPLVEVVVGLDAAPLAVLWRPPAGGGSA
jgi:hypothetical protein